MRKNLGIKGTLYPEPVLIIATYNEDDSPNAMNAAWGFVADYDKIGVILSKEHKTTKNILARKALTISIGTKATVVPCDYVGIVSGNDCPDKFAQSGFHASKSSFVDAPIIEELPLTYECELSSYDEEKELLLAKIVNVSAKEEILTGGKVDPSKLQPISFDGFNHTYLELGDKVADAFKAGLALKK